MKPIPLFLFAVMVLTLLGFGQISTAYAHDLEAGQISVLLKEDEAMVIVSPTADLFEFADGDQNGLLSVTEVTAYQAAIQTLVKQEVTLYNEDRISADIVYAEAFVPGIESEDPTREDAFLQVFLNYRWETTPEIVDVQFNLFNSAGDEVAWLMKDERTGEVIEGVFSQSDSLTRLRGEGTPTENSWGIWLTGVEHVLSGYDHILFILALVLATAGFRKLFIPLTAFTLAHTVT
ncbi:MAG: HupE/UreJ family protein, partial [Anaerolineae bacterium]